MMYFKTYKIKLLLLLFFVIVSGTLVGCGYKFSGGGTMPSGTGMICISLFNNRTSEAMLENTIVNALVYEFTRNGQKISKNKESADSIMAGEIKSVNSETVTQTESLTSIESRVTVALSVLVKDQNGDVLWENRNISDSEVYTVSSNNSSDSAAKKEALRKISERISVKIYSGMTEDF